MFLWCFFVFFDFDVTDEFAFVLFCFCATWYLIMFVHLWKHGVVHAGDHADARVQLWQVFASDH